jgi:hypothetical protein
MASRDVSGWVGWVFFAGFLMIIQGLFQATQGIVAVLNNDVIVSAAQNIWVLDITTWGWVHLFLGVLVLIAAFGVFRGETWALSIAVVLTVLSAFANFAYLPIYPLWATAVLVVDGLVLYALVAHGSELKA